MTNRIRKYLFVDDSLIDRSHAVHRAVGQPQKHPGNPLLKADVPWEQGLKLYGSVLHDGGRYRMWYQMLHFWHAASPRFATGVGYAESRDGLRWKKPRCGVTHPVHGPTNLVMLSAGRAHLCSPSVVRDDTDPDPARRYKMMFYDTMSAEHLEAFGSPFPPDASVPGWRAVPGEGMFVCTSPDGLHWQRPVFPAFPGPNDVAALSQLADGRLLAAYKTSNCPDRHFRVIETAESRDGARWRRHGIVLEPDWRDPPGTEFYGMSAFEYFGNLLGLVCVYHNSPDNKSLDIQLAAGEEVGRWARAAERGVLLPTGPRGSWDGGGIYVASAPLVSPPKAPDEIRLYYSGISARHDDMRYKEWSIGLATLRLDGFAAMRAGYFTGWLKTRPVNATGPRIRVNADCRHGSLALLVLDPRDGRVLARAPALVRQDNVALQPALEIPEPFAGREVVLAFEMQKCDLYSFWFEA